MGAAASLVAPLSSVTLVLNQLFAPCTLNERLTRELAEDGYSGVEGRVTPMRTEVIIRATRTQNVLGEKGRRMSKELPEMPADLAAAAGAPAS